MEYVWGESFEGGQEMRRTRRMRERMRGKGSEWWSEEIRRVAERKKECFLVCRETRSDEELEEYRRI